MGSHDVLRSWQGLRSGGGLQPAQGFTALKALCHARGLAVALALALGLVPLKGPATTAEHREEEEKEPISLDAASEVIDYKNNTADFQKIVVSQGTTRITADTAHAVGLDEQGFQDGRWTFRGNVRIDAEPRGTLRSDEAVVEFREKHISTATATGKPAEFQQARSENGQLTRGHAALIVYDVGAGTVRLTKDAWLTDGQNQVSGPLVIYDIKRQRWEAKSARPDNRVHIVIVPHSNTPAPKSGSGKSASGQAGGKGPPPP
jgi:lipopolysaccharide export system protein LptA